MPQCLVYGSLYYVVGITFYCCRAGGGRNRGLGGGGRGGRGIGKKGGGLRMERGRRVEGRAGLVLVVYFHLSCQKSKYPIRLSHGDHRTYILS